MQSCTKSVRSLLGALIVHNASFDSFNKSILAAFYSWGTDVNKIGFALTVQEYRLRIGTYVLAQLSN